jgi:hypothetical protein
VGGWGWIFVLLGFVFGIGHWELAVTDRVPEISLRAKLLIYCSKAVDHLSGD